MQSITQRPSKVLVLIFFTLFLNLAPCWGQTASQAVRYQVDTSLLKNHRLKIQAQIPAQAFPGVSRELALAVWTPGSYKVRDYSRFVDNFRVLNPGATVKKTRKNRWLVEGLNSQDTVLVEYEVYGHDLTVRTNYFTEELCLIIGAATFVAPAPLRSDEMKILAFEVSFPGHSGQISCGLTSASANSFVAEDYDQLADCPILLGDISIHSFQAGGVKHNLVQTGDTDYWNLNKSVKDTAKLVETIQKFWGEIPYTEYSFQNLITDTRGGLEHRNSTVVMTSRFATEEREKYVAWLGLLSHEFFHTWNVKRLRPKSLGPFNYEDEVYTRSLWIAEGITSYYDALLVRRAGLSTRKEYLKNLSKGLNRLKTTPGRRRIPLADASFDTWIRLYQPSDDLHNSNISYYNKGAIVAWLLDSKIQQDTQGKKSLDDVMRAAYRQFRDRGFTEAEFRELASAVTGLDLDPFFQTHIDSTQDLDITPALDYWGLNWKAKSGEDGPYLGLSTEVVEGQIWVSKVLADSPAAKAGIAPGDELLALAGLRVDRDTSLDFSEHLKVGRGYQVLLARLGKVQQRKIVPSKPPHIKSQLKFRAESPVFKARRESWLGPKSGDS